MLNDVVVGALGLNCGTHCPLLLSSIFAPDCDLIIRSPALNAPNLSVRGAQSAISSADISNQRQATLRAPKSIERRPLFKADLPISCPR